MTVPWIRMVVVAATVSMGGVVATALPAQARNQPNKTGLPLYVHSSPGGAASRWIRVRFPRLHAFAVELAAGRLSRGGVRRHVSAVLAMAGV